MEIQVGQKYNTHLVANGFLYTLEIISTCRKFSFELLLVESAFRTSLSPVHTYQLQGWGGEVVGAPVPYGDESSTMIDKEARQQVHKGYLVIAKNAGHQECPCEYDLCQ